MTLSEFDIIERYFAPWGIFVDLLSGLDQETIVR